MNEIIIPRNEKKELNIFINDDDNFSIILNENSELNLLLNFNSNKDCKNNFNIHLKENSKLNLINFQKLHENIINFNERNAKLEKNSNFNLFDLNFGSKLITSNVNVNLDGENSRFEHFGVFAVNNDQKFDFNINSFHNAPNTYSNMLTKGSLNDKSIVNYNGLIKINKNAHNSNGYQKNDTILLNENSQSNSIPKLEIDNNEVRCTHGSSTSYLDENMLFYLMSRGLNEKEAKITLVKGFLNEIINKVNFGELDEIIGEKIK